MCAVMMPNRAITVMGALWLSMARASERLMGKAFAALSLLPIVRKPDKLTAPLTASVTLVERTPSEPMTGADAPHQRAQ